MILRSNAKINAENGVTIPIVKLKEFVSSSEINGSIDNLEVSSDQNIDIKGTSIVKTLNILTDVSVSLDKSAVFGNLTLLGEKQISESIQNYEEVKAKIAMISGENNPDSELMIDEDTGDIIDTFAPTATTVNPVEISTNAAIEDNTLVAGDVVTINFSEILDNNALDAIQAAVDAAFGADTATVANAVDNRSYTITVNEGATIDLTDANTITMAPDAVADVNGNNNTEAINFTIDDSPVPPTADTTNPVVFTTNTSPEDNKLSPGDVITIKFSEALSNTGNSAISSIQYAVNQALGYEAATVEDTGDQTTFTITANKDVDLTADGKTISVAAGDIQDRNGVANVDPIDFTITDLPVSPTAGVDDPVTITSNAQAEDYALAGGDVVMIKFSEALENGNNEAIDALSNALTGTSLEDKVTVSADTDNPLLYTLTVNDGETVDLSIAQTISLAADSVTDVNGVANDSIISFLINDPDKTSPTAASTNPVEITTNVAENDKQLAVGDVVTLSFSEEMDNTDDAIVTAITSELAGTVLEGKATVAQSEGNPSNYTLTFDAAVDLPQDGVTIALDANTLTDANGVQNEEPIEFTLSDPDIAPPTAAGTDPVTLTKDENNQLTAGEVVTLTFSEGLDDTGVTALQTAVDDSFGEGVATVSTNPNNPTAFTITVNANENIDITGSKTLTLAAGSITDINGVSNSEDITFVVSDETIAPTAAEDGTVTFITHQASEDYEVVADDVIQIAFSENLDNTGDAAVDAIQLAVNKTFGLGNATVSATTDNPAAYDITFNDTIDLTGGKTITIDSGDIYDENGHVNDAPIAFTFTDPDVTSPTADETSPVLLSTNAVAEDNSLAAGDIVTLTFNEALKNSDGEAVTALTSALANTVFDGKVAVAAVAGDNTNSQQFTLTVMDGETIDTTDGVTLNLPADSVEDVNGLTNDAVIAFTVSDAEPQ